MSQHNITAVRAFVEEGSIAHLVNPGSAKAVCDANPWPSAWCFRPDDAKELPLCMDCLHIVTRPARKRKR